MNLFLLYYEECTTANYFKCLQCLQHNFLCCCYNFRTQTFSDLCHVLQRTIIGENLVYSLSVQVCEWVQVRKSNN